MRLHRLVLTNYRGITHRELEFPDHGVIVVCDPRVTIPRVPQRQRRFGHIGGPGIALIMFGHNIPPKVLRLERIG